MEENNELINNPAVEYTDDNIRHLSDMEHVRTRPGMYIGKLGDGSHAEDGIYVLLKEIIDNSIDEFKMQAGKKIEIIIEENLRVSVRDYGRGIPQGKLIEAVSVLNTGGKYDSKAFKKSVVLHEIQHFYFYFTFKKIVIRGTLRKVSTVEHQYIRIVFTKLVKHGGTTYKSTHSGIFIGCMYIYRLYATVGITGLQQSEYFSLLRKSRKKHTQEKQYSD